jgi:hypothetical protein
MKIMAMGTLFGVDKRKVWVARSGLHKKNQELKRKYSGKCPCFE